MGLHEDKLAVNEAYAHAWECRNKILWLVSKRRLSTLLRQTCEAYFRLHEQNAEVAKAARSLDLGNRADVIEIEQRLARILVKHCEDKKNPPYVHADGACDIGLKTARMLTVEVGERIDQIVRFRDVLSRKLLEERDEYEKKLGELRDQIRIKDEALLAAADRIKGQAEALSAAAMNKPCACSVGQTKCSRCKKPVCPTHNPIGRIVNDATICKVCDDQILF